MPAALLLLAAVLLACNASPMPIAVRSERFPQVEIQCQGESGLTVDDCRNWGEEMLAPAPPQGAAGEELDVTRLVLTYRTGNARCAADYLTADGRLAMTAAVRCPST